MADNRTTFQKLTDVVIGAANGYDRSSASNSVVYNVQPSSKVLFATDDKEERDTRLKQLKQQRYMAYQWKKTGYETSMEQMAGASQVKVMYRDADLMSAWPEIGSALHTIAEEATTIKKGKILNIYSKSERVQAVLEDLFINRLDFNVWCKTIAFATAKYGNEYMLLNIDEKNGVTGWREMPVHEMTRLENGMQNAYAGTYTFSANAENLKPGETKFVWEGHNAQMNFKNWMVAHFRLVNDSIYLPYGCIVGDTRIETENGFKEIDSIEIGDRVWTFDVNTQKKVLATVSMGAFKGVKDVYSVKTKHNYIEGTSDHKLLCSVNGELVYKEIQDIEPGDLLVVDNSFNKQQTLVAINKSNLTADEANFDKSIKWWTEKINLIPDFVDTEFAEFFGFMLGDGWVDSHNGVSFATGVYDSFNKRFADYLQKITGNKILYKAPKYKKNYDIAQITVYSKCLSIILKRMGFLGKFNEKRIPAWVFSASDEIKKAFVRGIMIADGWFNVDKYGVLRCSIEMSNEQLVKDLKTLVQSLGYKTGQINSRNRVGKRALLDGTRYIESKSTSYYFSYYETFNEQEKKYEINNRKESGFKTEVVRSKEYVGQKKTYDITVDNENSNFFANGIVTHNCSWLNSSRRHWRILSMMEDAMLLYRLERSVERRIFKVNVGLIDDADVPAFLQEFMNTVKRAPIIDPKTGQLDLRKNFLDVSADYVIPVRPGQDPTSIDNLPSAQNPTSMDDINYIEGKVLCGLRVPKTYLNFQEPQGRGQNLSLLDIRFSRAINGLQQAILLELNKVAIIHLYLLGFTDELTNFTLSLNNPSNQIEMMELDNLVKKLSAASTALSQQGGGLPLMSWHGVQKKIMGLTDKEIAELLDEIRLETAVAIEIQRTPEIIKQTHLFDRVDRIYGEPGAKYSDNPQGQGGEGGLDFGGGGGGGMPPMGGGFGDELGDLGEPGADTSGDIGGETGEANLGDLGGGEAPAGGAPEPLAESKVSDSYSAYIERLKKQTNEITNERVKLLDKNFIINEELNSAIKSLEEISKNKSKDDEIVF